MTSRIHTSRVFTNLTTSANSEKFSVADSRHLVLQLFLAGVTGVFKVKVSNADDVDFSSPSTITNPWYYVDLKGLGDSATTVTGSTGISTTTETSYKAYAINVDLAKWVGVEAGSVSAGTYSALLSQATNE